MFPPVRRSDFPRVVVVGGGISGLSAASELLRSAAQRGVAVEVAVFEASSELGGQIRTERVDGMLLEWGPDSLVGQKPAGGELCARLGLHDEIVRFESGEPTFELLHEGRLHPLPSGFVMMAPTRLGPLFESSLFTTLGKLRVASERFLPPRRSERDDESLRDFVVRRFGREAYERVAEPILGGLFTADAERLSMRCAAPRLLELELRHGSVTTGFQRMRAAERAGGGRHSGAGGFFSIRSGLSTLVDRLAARLPEGSVRLATPVRRIERQGDGYSVISADGRETEAVAVVLAGPAWASAQMLRDLDPELAEALGGLGYASCSTVHLAYGREQVGRPLSTYGFFVPRASGLPILACTDVSAKYPGRAPVDRVLLRVFLGGAGRPETDGFDARTQIDVAHRSVARLLEIKGPPVFGQVRDFPRSMPQFPVGYSATIELLAERSARHPGLVLCGGAVGALGLPDCIASGRSAGDATLEYVASARKTNARRDARSA
ncbi:MAG: protoporphyrinogen oxidase [Deltaproteobacteria bacterium]|nr:MAG: protoporphyrinogen oxidase [Deltaproteobacteria bacterium]